MAIHRVAWDVTYALANAELATVLRGRVVALPEGEVKYGLYILLYITIIMDIEQIKEIAFTSGLGNEENVSNNLENINNIY